MKRHINSALALGSLAVLLLSAGGSIPAHAQDYHQGNHWRDRRIQRDLDAISRDRQRLSDLRARADDQKSSGDWDGLHRTQYRITQARRDLQRDQATLQTDRNR